MLVILYTRFALSNSLTVLVYFVLLLATSIQRHQQGNARVWTSAVKSLGDRSDYKLPVTSFKDEEASRLYPLPVAYQGPVSMRYQVLEMHWTTSNVIYHYCYLLFAKTRERLLCNGFWQTFAAIAFTLNCINSLWCGYFVKHFACVVLYMTFCSLCYKLI